MDVLSLKGLFRRRKQNVKKVKLNKISNTICSRQYIVPIQHIEAFTEKTNSI